MLKLPKGLKKKKKGKKSKKDQELFTEEELEQYRREHQKPKADESSDANQHSADEREDVAASAAAGPSVDHHYHHHAAAAAASSSSSAGAAAQEDADEWRRFNALATGVDSILKKTQGDLDRIKSTSFFKRVPPPSELQKQEDEKRAKEEEALRLKQEEERKLEEEKKADKLASAVIELSESEEEEESVHEEGDIFDTTYIDVVKDLPLAYVPESPEKEEAEGPDPFDTSYADTVITKVSRRGKPLVNIGAAVEVLTGRVEADVVRKPLARRPRRGPLDLLLVQSFDDENAEEWLEKVPEPVQPTKTLLDSPATDLPDEPIDLTKSLHLSLVKEKKKEAHSDEEGEDNEKEDKEEDKKSTPSDDGAEQALLAFFGATPAAPRKEAPAAPAPAKKSGLDEIIGEGEYDLQEDDGVDPFDTQFVAKILPASLNEDPDFDPRAENPDLTPVKELFSPDFPKEEIRTDLLEGEVEEIPDPVITVRPRPKAGQKEVDPFDTSAVNDIVAPGKTELKFLEKELAKTGPPPRPPTLPQAIASRLKPSLSDDDFDPRAGEDTLTQEERKASLTLQIQPQHKVTFAIPTPDLLAVDHEGKIQKPLTPYYEKPSGDKSESPEDPFDTSFVGSIAPSEVELNQLAKDLLPTDSAAKLSDDDDFDPRAVTPQPKADWLAPEDHDRKVLTPAVETKNVQAEEESSYLHDPFDTSSVEVKLQPGQAELKLIESELLPEIHKESVPVVDILSDSQDDSLPVKALTPVVPVAEEESPEDIDPFDTSFAANLGPGRAEIKLLESELIEQ